VRCQHDILDAGERMVRRQRLILEHVQARAPQRAGQQRVDQRSGVDQPPARDVQQTFSTTAVGFI
jgi:hypothetical protein